MRIAPFLLAVLAIAGALSGCSRSGLADGVTQQTVKSLKIGMPLDSVLKTIGLPLYAEYGTGIHDGRCRASKPIQHFVPADGPSIVAAVDSAYRSPQYCCNTELEMRTRKFTLEYSRRPFGFVAYPMLWVHFDEKHCLRQVYAKVYYPWGLDESGVYLLSAGDSLYPGQHVCTENLFSRFFPDP